MNRDDQTAVCRVLSQFPETERRWSVVPLRSAGGFSGAEFWRVSSEFGDFCLRRWPVEHPSESQLCAIHQILQGVIDWGVEQVAAPIPCRSSQSIVKENGSLWELTRWMPGSANYHQSPSQVKLSAAMQVLARFHRAAAACSSPTVGTPPGITARYGQLQRLLQGGFAELRKVVPTNFGYGQSFLECFPILAPRVHSLLERSISFQSPVQPCIRDIWHDHVLFTDDRVTGLIDFGAMKSDHIACDIARLLGSLVRDVAADWAQGLAAYKSVRPLEPADHQLIVAYDQSSVLLSAMNWLQWLFVEGRRFDDLDRVRSRCAEIAARLTNLTAKSPIT